MQLDEALAMAALGGASKGALLVCEFCDTRGPDQLYRKYGVYRIGDELVYRLINFDLSWIVKSPSHVTSATLAEEANFVQTRPFHDEIWSAFETARIDFGGIDFSLQDGRMRGWEINTNPGLLHAPTKYRPGHWPNLNSSLSASAVAIEKLLVHSSESIPLKLTSGALPASA